MKVYIISVNIYIYTIYYIMHNIFNMYPFLSSFKCLELLLLCAMPGVVCVVVSGVVCGGGVWG